MLGNTRHCAVLVANSSYALEAFWQRTLNAAKPEARMEAIMGRGLLLAGGVGRAVR